MIDDNPADQELAKIYLGQSWPFHSAIFVDTALDGFEALEKMRVKPYCLIILDWCMSKGGNGHVLRAMRHNGVFIPVVVLSGLAREQLPADLEAAGAAYVDKNVLNASTLYHAIVAALRNCRPLRPSAGSSERCPGPSAWTEWAAASTPAWSNTRWNRTPWHCAGATTTNRIAASV